MNGVRIDKWLWAARFLKTRALAARACELGRVQSNGQPLKPAREIHVGQQLAITTDGGVFQVEVLALGETRGPAAVAQTLYRESEASKEARAKAAAERKALAAWEQLPDTRPNKRDRRTLSRLRGRM
ncbi:MAG TPA: RNA-binding S4 domain-containing protein [Acidobacteriaceae bacterium]|jgi:ribosome-associated heat shock protein Hsp15|nr:RNA-binding S4 domain-containing protein [Acidobacteriaceae bacterium]